MINHPIFRRWLRLFKPAWGIATSAGNAPIYEYLGQPMIFPFPLRDPSEPPVNLQSKQPGNSSSTGDTGSTPGIQGNLGADPGLPNMAVRPDQTLPTAAPIRVAVVEDQANVRANLEKLLNGAPGFSCVATCIDVADALKTIPKIKPDVVLMDINLPGGRSGIDCTLELCELMPGIQIIMLTIEVDGERVFDSLKAGATGYLVKHAKSEEILDAITEVQRGGAPMSSGIARKVVTAFRQPPPAGVTDGSLSPQQEKILKFLAQGLNTKEIAEELGIAMGVVYNYIRVIYKKLHVRSRAQAVAKYKEK